MVALLCGMAALPSHAFAAAGWNYENSGTWNWLSSVAFTDAQHGWAVGASGTIVATTNGG